MLPLGFESVAQSLMFGLVPGLLSGKLTLFRPQSFRYEILRSFMDEKS